jgi:hypothetical protein
MSATIIAAPLVAAHAKHASQQHLAEFAPAPTAARRSSPHGQKMLPMLLDLYKEGINREAIEAEFARMAVLADIVVDSNDALLQIVSPAKHADYHGVRSTALRALALSNAVPPSAADAAEATINRSTDADSEPHGLRNALTIKSRPSRRGDT